MRDVVDVYDETTLISDDVIADTPHVMEEVVEAVEVHRIGERDVVVSRLIYSRVGRRREHKRHTTALKDLISIETIGVVCLKRAESRSFYVMDKRRLDVGVD